QEGKERASVETVRTLQAGHLQERGEKIHDRDEVVPVARARLHDAGPANEQRGAGTVKPGVALRKGHRETSVGDEQDQRVVAEAGFFEGVNDAAKSIVEAAGGIQVSCEFLAHSREVR